MSKRIEDRDIVQITIGCKVCKRTRVFTNDKARDLADIPLGTLFNESLEHHKGCNATLKDCKTNTFYRKNVA